MMYASIPSAEQELVLQHPLWVLVACGEPVAQVSVGVVKRWNTEAYICYLLIVHCLLCIRVKCLTDNGS